jgi:aminoglycoside phosphotransferase (APT) family kinase protein
MARGGETVNPGRYATRLHAYLEADPRWAGAGAGALQFLARGWESEIYLQEFPASEPVVLRLYPAAGSASKAAREHRGLELLHRAGYPVPEVYGLETDLSIMGCPFLLMEYIPGEQMWPVLVRLPEGERLALLREFSHLLADLHYLDWQQFTGERPAEPGAWIAAWLEFTRRELEYFNLPGFLPAFDWLVTHRSAVSPQKPSAVHWDFHPANVLLNPATGPVVVDWTQFQVTDARFDLAWTLLLVGAYESEAWRAAVLDDYEDRIGAAVQNLGWFDAAVAIKRLGSMVVALTASPETTGMMDSAAMIMREHFPAYHWIYNLFQERTGLRLADVENILQS